MWSVSSAGSILHSWSRWASSTTPRVRPRNVAKRNVAKRYFGAPLIYGNRRSGHFRSTFKLHCDKEIRAVDIFVVPDFAASRTPAIEIDGVRVPSWLTGSYDPDYAAGGMFSVYYMRQDVLKILLAILGCCPNSLIFLRDGSSRHRWRCQTEGY